MQDVTNLPFMRALVGRSLPDWLVTEYFRVHPDSKLHRSLLRAIVENPTNRPVFAQMIGDDLPSLCRTASELADYPIAGIDLNLGCPAPIVCRKNAGGGLLRDPAALHRLLGGLRAAIPGRFTVKTRIGYVDRKEFAALLAVFAAHGLDGVTIHARTVKQGYHGGVHADCVRLAVDTLTCPVIANGNIVDVATGLAYFRKTGAAGLMVGRGAIRNPWIFGQLQAAFEGGPAFIPSHRDLLAYIEHLYAETAAASGKFSPTGHVQRMKRTLGYISHGLDPAFEFSIRRCRTPDEFWAICRAHLDHDAPLPLTPPVHSKLFNGFTDLLTP